MGASSISFSRISFFFSSSWLQSRRRYRRRTLCSELKEIKVKGRPRFLSSPRCAVYIFAEENTLQPFVIVRGSRADSYIQSLIKCVYVCFFNVGVRVSTYALDLSYSYLHLFTFFLVSLKSHFASSLLLTASFFSDSRSFVLSTLIHSQSHRMHTVQKRRRRR